MDAILEGLPRDFDSIITLIESRLPHITIEEAEGYILVQELHLRKYTRLESSSNSFTPTVNLTQASLSHSNESDNWNSYSDTNVVYTNQYSSDS